MISQNLQHPAGLSPLSSGGGNPTLSAKQLAKLDVLPQSEATAVGGAGKKSRNSNGGPRGELSQESDSFYKYYNKEIKVNQEEIPIVLYELVDAAYNYIQRESYEKALILLQKTEGVLDVVSLDSSKRDRYIAYTTFHNMAMCYQKLGMLEECFIYLKECLGILTQPDAQPFYKYTSENCVAVRMKQLRQECKLKLQLCAILSQTQNHTEALDNAKKSVKIIHQLFRDLLSLCAMYIRKMEKKALKKAAGVKAAPSTSVLDQAINQNTNLSESDEDEPLDQEGSAHTVNFLEESISMLERTSLKLYPVVKEVLKRIISETQKPTALTQQQDDASKLDAELEKMLLLDESELTTQADMRSVLGFLNQNEWVHQLNIGNIMQLQPISLQKDLLSQARNECELSRDSFLDKMSLLSVSYFCVSTEMRFILQSREQYLSSPIKKTRELESEFWHAKSLEIACTFLPSECPLLNHILLSYQKHHNPANQPIKEDQEQTDVLAVIRPLHGIESSKHQPIVRQLNNVKVHITPCQISPITKRIFSANAMLRQPRVIGRGGLNPQNHSQQAQKAPTMSVATVSSNLSGGLGGHAASQAQAPGDAAIVSSQDINIQNQNPSSQGHSSTENRKYKEEAEIVMYDQQEQIRQTSSVQLPPDRLQCNPLQSSSTYSDDYYEKFVRRIFEDNPMLDKRQLVTKFLSHLQSQDYSFLQQQINDQHLLQDEDEDDDLGDAPSGAPLGFNSQNLKKKTGHLQKEQRQTVIHFDNDEQDMISPQLTPSSPNDAINVEEIMMVNQSFDIIKQLKGFQKQKGKKQHHLSGLDQPISQSPNNQEFFDEDELQPASKKNHAWEKHIKAQKIAAPGILGGGGIISSSSLPKNSATPSGHSSSKNRGQVKQFPSKQSFNSSHSQKLQASKSHQTSNSQQSLVGKKKPATRVQKLMSYLEGDSLLKEIERSLENHNREEKKNLLTYDDDEDEDDLDPNALLQESQDILNQHRSGVRGHPEIDQRQQAALISKDEADDKVLDKSYRFINQEQLQAAFVDLDAMNNSGGSCRGASDFNNEADDEEETNNKRHRQQRGLEPKRLNAVEESSKDSGSRSGKRRITSGKGRLANYLTNNTVARSSTSYTRPSSSITNHTSMTSGILGGRRSSHSLVKGKKYKRNNGLSSQHHQLFTSQQNNIGHQAHISGSPITSSPSKESHKAHSDTRQGGFSSITAGASGSKQNNTNFLRKRETSNERQNSKIVSKFEQKKRGRSLKGGLNQQKSHQQLSGNRKDERSRSSNQFNHNHFKSMGIPINQSRLSNNNRRQGDKSKSSEERSSSTKHRLSRPQSSQQNYPQKKRDNSAETTSNLNNPEAAFTPAGRGSQIPFLSQPSFSDNTNTGTKGFNPPHTYSVDISVLQKQQKSMHPSKVQSISSLQQQVLENQRLLQQFSTQQKKRQTPGKSQKRRQQDNAFPNQQILAQMLQAATQSMEGSKLSNQIQSRVKKQSKLRGPGSMTSTSGVLKFTQNGGAHQQSIDHPASRQNAFGKGLHATSFSTAKQSQAFLGQPSQTSLIQSSVNKENHMSQGKRGSHDPGYSASYSSTKRKYMIRELAQGLIHQHQKSLSREFNRPRVDQNHHYLIESTYSPSRNKRQHQQQISHSPPAAKRAAVAKSGQKGSIQKVKPDRPKSANKKSQQQALYHHRSFAQEDHMRRGHPFQQDFIQVAPANQGLIQPNEDCFNISTAEQQYRPSFGDIPLKRGSTDVIQLQPQIAQIIKQLAQKQQTPAGAILPHQLQQQQMSYKTSNILPNRKVSNLLRA